MLWDIRKKSVYGQVHKEGRDGIPVPEAKKRERKRDSDADAKPPCHGLYQDKPRRLEVTPKRLDPHPFPGGGDLSQGSRAQFTSGTGVRGYDKANPSGEAGQTNTKKQVSVLQGHDKAR
ncbi:hypothetical protein COCCADRAFT_21648 [Bipolaris zeicola 26-R-13]|uniref:Uncharacterized protein n=1 Tax=Cochliobolus carbonum (strain 26-R-13) TaxID=930089 RepID=W6YHV4_COCC2|nr:uncharacterized protein COCCADRAFT_21648 [Bipolaris zeicola 26-R-13]EUC38892.1 hypothetical protein COCCADRAFT_21648 [Bipolaris zeicola 26-R-13]